MQKMWFSSWKPPKTTQKLHFSHTILDVAQICFNKQKMQQSVLIALKTFLETDSTDHSCG